MLHIQSVQLEIFTALYYAKFHYYYDNDIVVDRASESRAWDQTDRDDVNSATEWSPTAWELSTLAQASAFPVYAPE